MCYFQADLGGKFKVYRIATQGRNGYSPEQYVQTYTVSYSTEETGENFVAAEAGQVGLLFFLNPYELFIFMTWFLQSNLYDNYILVFFFN